MYKTRYTQLQTQLLEPRWSSSELYSSTEQDTLTVAATQNALRSLNSWGTKHFDISEEKWPIMTNYSTSIRQ